LKSGILIASIKAIKKRKNMKSQLQFASIIALINGVSMPRNYYEPESGATATTVNTSTVFATCNMQPIWFQRVFCLVFAGLMLDLILEE
jgi:hypothetical protein